MKKIVSAFSFVFADDEWFNKMLIGGIYLLLTPLGIGLVMILGYQGQVADSIRHNKSGLPMWRNSSLIFQNGIRLLCVSVVYAAILVGCVSLAGVELLSIPMLGALIVGHILINPLIILSFTSNQSLKKSLNPLSLIAEIRHLGTGYIVVVFATSLLLLASLLFGWMFIVVGWPLVIFLILIVQTSAFAF